MATGLCELMWAAGYLDGEGSFSDATKSLTVKATSTDQEPLRQLRSMFGGSICKLSRRLPRHKPAEQWTLTGERAAGVMMTLYLLLCPRRRAQVRSAMATWRCRRQHHRRTVCPSGHAYTNENTYLRPDGKGRDCYKCRRTRS